ncbi:MAG: hypothetical protein MR407_11105 [Roseburia sp.]|nr:hypothetical protein [Roseburia sp.]
MLSKAGNETYKYDVYNRLVEYLLDDGSKSESYTYDAEGVRRSKVMVGGEETKEIFFVSDTFNELSRTVAETKMETFLLSTVGEIHFLARREKMELLHTSTMDMEMCEDFLTRKVLLPTLTPIMLTVN